MTSNASTQPRTLLFLLAWLLTLTAITLTGIAQGAGTQISSHDTSERTGTSLTIWTSDKAILGNLALFTYTPYYLTPTARVPSNTKYTLYPNSLLSHVNAIAAGSTKNTIIPIYTHIWSGPGGDASAASYTYANTYLPGWTNNNAAFAFALLAVLALLPALVALPILAFGSRVGDGVAKVIVVASNALAFVFSLVSAAVLTGVAVKARRALIGEVAAISGLGGALMAVVWITVVLVLLVVVVVGLGTRMSMGEVEEEGRVGFWRAMRESAAQPGAEGDVRGEMVDQAKEGKGVGEWRGMRDSAAQP